MQKQVKKEGNAVSLEEYSRLKKIYAEELKRKDDIIDKLREENRLLMKSALKQSEKNVMLSEKLKEKTKQVV